MPRQLRKIQEFLEMPDLPNACDTPNNPGRPQVFWRINSRLPFWEGKFRESRFRDSRSPYSRLMTFSNIWYISFKTCQHWLQMRVAISEFPIHWMNDKNGENKNIKLIDWNGLKIPTLIRFQFCSSKYAIIPIFGKM